MEFLVELVKLLVVVVKVVESEIEHLAGVLKHLVEKVEDFLVELVAVLQTGSRSTLAQNQSIVLFGLQCETLHPQFQFQMFH